MPQDRITAYYDKKAKNYISFSEKYRNVDRTQVIELMDLKSNDLVLDAGCGSGFFTLGLYNMGHKVKGVDISPEMIKELKKKGVDGLISSIVAFRSDKKYDHILCYGVLEFVDDVSLALENLKRHLAIGGKITIGVPLVSPKSIPYVFYHLIVNRKLVHIFTKRKIGRLINSIGLRVEKDVMINALDYCCRLSIDLQSNLN